MRSERPYFGIGGREGRLIMTTALGGTDQPEDWPEFFCAGVPVLWDGLAGEALLDRMLCEAADHSHLYDLPRGHHPHADETTRALWEELQAIFVSHVHAPEAVAARALRQALDRITPALKRADDYFHALLGVREDGALECVFAHGRLEDLGRIMGRHGCRRAICVENSGSVMPTFLPQGSTGPVIPLIRAPNFRPRGRALLVLELPDARFGSAPLGRTPSRRSEKSR